eukprot:16365457-Heterocapsa_arctica.AAC.1
MPVIMASRSIGSKRKVRCRARQARKLRIVGDGADVLRGQAADLLQVDEEVGEFLSSTGCWVVVVGIIVVGFVGIAIPQ